MVPLRKKKPSCTYLHYANAQWSNVKTKLTLILLLFFFFSAFRELFGFFDLSMSIPPKTCESAYAYCPGRSECFIGNYVTSPGGGANGPWGWNIDLENVDLTDGNTLTCPVYAGAGQCDFENKGTHVGSLIISEDAVTWDFFDGFGGEDFHLYAGKCGANDRGYHLQDGVCDPSDMNSNARNNGRYTLVAPNEDEYGSDAYDPVLTDFSFDINNDEGGFRKGIWKDQGYAAFPLVGDNRRYLSAHSSVCACTAVSGGCTTPPPPSITEVPPEDLEAPEAPETPEAPADVADGTSSTTNRDSGGLSTPGLTSMVVILVAAAVITTGVVVYRRVSASSIQSLSSSSVSEAASLASAV